MSGGKGRDEMKFGRRREEHFKSFPVVVGGRFLKRRSIILMSWMKKVRR